MTEYYTTADLKERGWTDSIIKQHLGKPDGEHPNPQPDQSSGADHWTQSGH